jgi:hypothetical protein
VKVRKFWGGVRDTLLWGGRKSTVCEKVPRLRPLVLLVRVRVKVKALEVGVFTAPVYSNGHGADHIGNNLPIVETYLPQAQVY